MDANNIHDIAKAILPFFGTGGLAYVMVKGIEALRDIRLKRFDYDLECRRINREHQTLRE